VGYIISKDIEAMPIHNGPQFLKLHYPMAISHSDDTSISDCDLGQLPNPVSAIVWSNRLLSARNLA